MTDDDSTEDGPQSVDRIKTEANSVSHERIGPFSPDKHAKPDRVKLLDIPDSDQQLIFKGCRDGEKGVLDMFCDSLYAKLGNAYGVPTPKQVPIYREELGLGVVSPAIAGEQGIHGEIADFDNKDKIPLLVAFEEWIANHDDKNSHFWTVKENKTEILIVDHGHTVPRSPHLTDPNEARESSELEGPASNNNHFYDSVDQVQSGIDIIKSVEDNEISRSIKIVIEEFEELDVDDDRMSAFLSNHEGYEQATQIALKRRHESIESIIEQKYT